MRVSLRFQRLYSYCGTKNVLKIAAIPSKGFKRITDGERHSIFVAFLLFQVIDVKIGLEYDQITQK